MEVIIIYTGMWYKTKVSRELVGKKLSLEDGLMSNDMQVQDKESTVMCRRCGANVQLVVRHEDKQYFMDEHRNPNTDARCERSGKWVQLTNTC